MAKEIHYMLDKPVYQLLLLIFVIVLVAFAMSTSQAVVEHIVDTMKPDEPKVITEGLLVYIYDREKLTVYGTTAASPKMLWQIRFDEMP